MSQYNVSASVTSAPTDVALKIDDEELKMERNDAGVWTGKATLDLANSVPIAFRAVGIAAAPWTLEIKFNTLAPPHTCAKDYKHEDTIPEDLFSVLNDTVTLIGVAGA